MNKQEIQYERTISSSYMKVPALEKENLDVRIMLQRNLKGMIPVERCYIEGEGQYWYDISGKQALDSYIKMNSLAYSVFESLILRICEQLELLEWNLLDTNGLMVDPELIFLNNSGEEISFVFYPQTGRNILEELKKLLEYLLSKLDHTDRGLVQGAYELYELVLTERYQLEDMKHAILKRRIEQKKKNETEELRVVEIDDLNSQVDSTEEREVGFPVQLEEKFSAFCKWIKEIFIWHPKQEMPTVVYPEEDIEENSELVSHPTICIATAFGEARGVLIYEGMGEYPDFELKQLTCVIGKSTRAQLQIPKETISTFHAKIEYQDGYYIEDMNSTNGTFVNDEIVNYREKRILNTGDVIRFADVKYRFL